MKPPSSIGSGIPLATLLIAIGCSVIGSEPVLRESSAVPISLESLSGGETTVFDTTRNAFSLPAKNLNDAHRASFFVGNSFFNQNWVLAPASTAGRDGLGPMFNARSCSACHFKDGRSRPPEPGDGLSTLVLRISVAGTNATGGPRPDPIYGDQLQTSAIPNVEPEADATIEYTNVPGRYDDGEGYVLRQPNIRLTHPRYGPFASDLMLSARTAPALIGLGLLAAVPESTLRAMEDPDDRDGDGISGRLNLVWDHSKGEVRIGRFGWKAEQPSVFQQTAGAFRNDIGITSSVFPTENHTALQTNAVHRPSGGSPEISDPILSDVVLYAATLAVPARRDVGSTLVQQGSRLFERLGCASCHVPHLQTGEHPDLPELSRQSIQPYTDLLLHDLGEGLADHRPAYRATGREWRTAPLWGLGLLKKVNGHTFLLHDGRARDTAEAILWHDGEALAAQERFRKLPRADREALRTFLNSL